MEQLSNGDPGHRAIGELRRPDPTEFRRQLGLAQSVDALARLGGPSGWTSFPTLAGIAVDWPTAYVGEALLHVEHDDGVRHAIARLLADQQGDGGWGYHTGVPSDCDSTAYALALLATAGAESSAMDRAITRMLLMQRADGSFSTYPDPEPVRAFMRLDASVSFAGWTSAHPEVTAAAGRALVLSGEMPAAKAAWTALRAMQRPDGRWRSYWWHTDLYATAQAIRLAEALGTGACSAVDRARQWCLSQRHEQGFWTLSGRPSIFATALALQIMGKPDEAALDFIRERRRGDGLWDGEAALRIPLPWVTSPEGDGASWIDGGLGGGATVHDTGHCYGTATILLALGRGL